jgi:DNA-directed RNA polymerase subunit RPC12/RpoP
MGAMITVECSSCDYTKIFYAGVGMAGEMRYIYSCSQCSTISESIQTSFSCPKCEIKAKEIDLLDLKKISCPTCNNKSLNSEVTGMWD